MVLVSLIGALSVSFIALFAWSSQFYRLDLLEALSFQANDLKEVWSTGIAGLSFMERFIIFFGFTLIFVAFYRFHIRFRVHRKSLLAFHSFLLLLVLIFVFPFDRLEPNSLRLPLRLSRAVPLNVFSSALPSEDEIPLPSSEALPDVAILFMESLRADHFTTDFFPLSLSLLTAQPHVFFPRAVAAGTETVLSIPRLLHSRRNPGSQDFSCRTSALQYLQKRLNYQQIYWSAQSYAWKNLNEILKCSNTGSEFWGPEELRQTGLKTSSPMLHTVADREVLKSVTKWATRTSKNFNAPALYLLHNYDTHFPYLTQDSAHPEDTITFTDFGEALKTFSINLASRESFLQSLRGRYDQAARFSDTYLEGVISKLADRAQRRRRPLLVIVTSDHGELLGEHGHILHANKVFPYEEINRVPLFFSCLHCSSDLEKKFLSMKDLPTRYSGSHLEIVPTLYGLLGLPNSAASASEGLDLVHPPPEDMSSQPLFTMDDFRASLYFRQYKLVIGQRSEAPVVFDLKLDPHELNPLLGHASKTVASAVLNSGGWDLQGLLDKDRTIAVAHRGIHDQHIGDSLSAFQEAAMSGNQMVELDVRLTQDGTVVVFHDSHFTSLDGKTQIPEKYDLEYLRQNNLQQNNAHSPHEALDSIPTLDEVFTAFGRSLNFIVEMKVESGTSPPLAQAVADLIGKHHLSDHVMISSVNMAQASLFRKMFPHFNTLFELYSFKTSNEALSFLKRKVPPRSNTFVSFSTRLHSAELLKYIQTHYGGSSVFTPNTAQELKFFTDQGVNFIQTDRVDLLMGLLRIKKASD